MSEDAQKSEGAQETEDAQQAAAMPPSDAQKTVGSKGKSPKYQMGYSWTNDDGSLLD